MTEPNSAEWFWDRAKVLKVDIYWVLSHLKDLVDHLEVVTPYEPWNTWYWPGVPGYGSRAKFLAERAGLSPEELIRRAKQFLAIVSEDKVEVSANGNTERSY
jgi:hypothetical protein